MREFYTTEGRIYAESLCMAINGTDFDVLGKSLRIWNRLSVLVYSFDWSGAERHGKCLKGIACYGGRNGGTPTIARPVTSTKWSRSSACAFLVNLAAQAVQTHQTIIAGLDSRFHFLG